MKNTVLSFMLAFLVLAVSATALGEVYVNDTLIYFSANDDAYASATEFVSEFGYLNLKNTYNETVALRLANTELVLDSKNKINITASSFTIGPNATVRKELDIVSIKDIQAGVYTGTLQIVNNSNGYLYDEVAVKVLVPALSISKIEVLDTESGNKDTKLEKGQKITVKVDYENIADDTDLENMNIVVGFYKGDESDLKELVENADGDELEEEEDLSDLSKGKSSSKSFEFEVPFDVSDGDELTVLAEITGDGEDNGAPFYARLTKTVEVSVPDDKVEITKFTISPSTLGCDTNRAKVSLELTNIGDNSQDVEVFVRNSAAGFEKILNGREKLELGDDFTDEDEYIVTHEEYVDFEGLKAGANIITLVAYLEDDSNVQKEFTLTKESCTPATTTTATTTTTTQPDVVVVPTQTTPATTTTVSSPSTPYVQLKDVSGGFDSDLVVPIMIGIGGLLVGILVVMLLLPRP